MIERGQHFRLAVEAGHALVVAREDFGQYLDRHIALQFGIARAIHLAHAALADETENLIGTEFIARREGHLRYSV